MPVSRAARARAPGRRPACGWPRPACRTRGVTCRFTVSTVMNSSSAMARLGRPLAISASTSSSRVLSGCEHARCGDRAPARGQAGRGCRAGRTPRSAGRGTPAAPRADAELLEAPPDHAARAATPRAARPRRGTRAGSPRARRGRAPRRAPAARRARSPAASCASAASTRSRSTLAVAALCDRERPPTLQHLERLRAGSCSAISTRASTRYSGSRR